MRRPALTGLAALILASCGGPGGEYREAAPPPPSPVMSKMVMADMAAEDQGSAPSAPVEPGAEIEPTSEQYIAYSHNLGLSLPKGEVEPMMQGHSATCRAAGTATCIVVSSNIYSQDENYASANLSIRATPAWIEGFMSTVEEGASKAGGEITQRSTQAEDLTREIIDTGARLDAQETLQTRLKGLLERRDGTLSDLLEIERELARVTGDIESIKAQLKTLRLRVSMSSLDLSYQTKVPAFSGTRENPLGAAFADFFYNLSAAIAAVVTAFAVGLPWMLLFGVLIFIWLRLIWPWVRKSRKPKV